MVSHGDNPSSGIYKTSNLSIIELIVSNRHTFVAHSQNVTMTNLDMSAISNSQWKTVNTDGIDTWNSKDIVLKNWTVTCGDVSKAAIVDMMKEAIM
jgi:polygalacturonase